jgi:Xaa-Pro aminopeptidase
MLDEPLDPPSLVAQRRARLDAVLFEHGITALLTGDPFGIRYATGSRNMTVHGLTGPDRFALVVAGGPAILWEFAGCKHLSCGLPGVDEVRSAPAVSAKKSLLYADEAVGFAREVADLLDGNGVIAGTLALDRIDVAVVDALRERSLGLSDGTLPMQLAMAVKQPAEIDAMRAAMAATEQATDVMRRTIAPGRTEQEVWAEFHRALIAAGGEFVVARLLQAGERTFPYFREASDHVLGDGDLVCFDTDAVGSHGYSVDFSRTFLCGPAGPTSRQLELHAIAREQLEHNAANLAAGVPFEAFARRAYDVPEPFRRYGYYQLAHGLGLAGGHPNVPRLGVGPYPLPGSVEAGMVLCIESYVGDPQSRQGVKLEDQFLVQVDRVERMSTTPFDERLAG